MQTVEIKQNLKRLGVLVGRTNEVSLNGKILNYLLDKELINDEIEDCGLTIKEIYERNNDELTHSEIQNMLGSFSSDTILEIIGGLLIWNQLGECPECGCEIEIEEDSHGKHQWENKKCINKECGYSEINEPDWDSLPGGHDYY